MVTTLVEYTHDGDTLLGQIAIPDGKGPRPAVLVMHDARGLGSVALERLPRLAALGYVAFASDMYGGGTATFSNDPMVNAKSFMPMQQNPQRMRDRIVNAFELLRARPEVDPNRVAAIGFCFGGQCVLELARSGADAKAVVSYHGLLTTASPAKAGGVKATIAVYGGGLDPYAPAEHVADFEKEMRAAGATFHMTTFSDAYHAFTDPEASAMTQIPGVAYHPLADRLSWAGTVELLAEKIDGKGLSA